MWRKRALHPIVWHGPELRSWAQQVTVTPQELVLCEPWDKGKAGLWGHGQRLGSQVGEVWRGQLDNRKLGSLWGLMWERQHLVTFPYVWLRLLRERGSDRVFYFARLPVPA